MGGGRRQKGGKHGFIGRTLAHDILAKQVLQNENLRISLAANKNEQSILERNSVDEFTLAALHGLEQYVKPHAPTRGIIASDFHSQLGRIVNFNEQKDVRIFPVVPIPRRCVFFTEDNRILIEKSSKKNSKDLHDAYKKLYKRKNKKMVDLYMKGLHPKPLHGIYDDINKAAKIETARLPRETDELDSEDYDSYSDADSEYDDIDEVDTFSDSDEPPNTHSIINEVPESDGNDRYLIQYRNVLDKEIENVQIPQLNANDLDRIEMRCFYAWRRVLSKIEEVEGCVVTPYEKNIEYWRQLWRVIERCHLILTIVDARDPLFYRVPDLENYIKEVNPSKHILLVLNKADYVPLAVRNKWAEYFKAEGIDFVFFSVVWSLECKEDTEYVQDSNDCDESCRIHNAKDFLAKLAAYKPMLESGFPELKLDKPNENPLFTVGCVGYPNVGKSSLINCLLEATKTTISSQPGKTKHLQTLPLKHANLTLCDCPGMLFCYTLLA
ncbi:bifunctional Ras GTPase GNL1-like/GTP binding domain/P-loop containing nucleoside triphosphate hydrolase/Circularly permuted (CP)-type guanine nucleotide-binding (G) domain [Babesia duncani]|uniref:Bifunctional Ras GTPase GNL1-like/GTP binding domain/P-loop containing nucleoside triphosphate hydrolase/Circularly permuted (CP)-type guanine nucleotide-binding (G) domain n=1 Tax=Babesia duncani TaxID=323732 RepID=A0AAD9PJ27_9APIC|nr:bifunctional Ras GTPase GNL1-like/GTP binding domain/P-loop containing nucleoside triphosphate hydrolase/Circularly permuted (CP)-type guanine nucleotide-binding (G) domain [Babesia duncani]